MSLDIQLPLVRCYTCRKLIGSLAEPYNRLLAEGRGVAEALDELGVKRYCCRINLQNPPLLPAGAMVEDEIELMQQQLDRSHTEPLKSQPMGAVLAAMKQSGAKQLEFAGRTAQSVRVVPGVLSTVKVRRDYSFDDAYRMLKSYQLEDAEIMALFQAQGVSDENARKQKYRLRRQDNVTTIEVVPL